MDAALSTDMRRNGAVGAAETGGRKVIDQTPWRIPVNPDPPVEPLPAEGVARIHYTAMRILEEIGIEFLHAEARDILGTAGCRVDGTNVRMGRDFVMEMVAKAPSRFEITPRNRDRAISVGGRHIVFGNVSSPPSYWDMQIGRKVPGTRDMCRNLLKLTQYFNCLHFVGGYPVEPADIPAAVRHLDVTFDMLTLTDKAIHAYSLGEGPVEDVMDMVRIAGNLTEEAFEAAPRMYTNINSISPLRHGQQTTEGWMRLARRGQGLVVTPFTLAGASAPVTVSGAVSQSIAEALCMVALAQWIRPGAPCAWGTFTTNVDGRTGVPAFGTPEYMRATQMAGQMARFYGLPFRSSGICSATVPDGQAVWETEHSLWAALQSGSHMVCHAAGWLDGGMTASPEKFVMDCEMLQQLQRYMEPEIWDTTEDALAFDAIRDGGAAGHFLGCKHVHEREATAPYQPFLSERKTFEAWEAAGAVWTQERAHLLFQRILQECDPAPMDAAIRDELADFVARRKAACAASAGV